MIIIILNIAFLLALVFWGYKSSRGSALLTFYWPGIILKITAGIFVGILYSNYYASGDSWVIFAEAVKLKNVAFHSFSTFINVYFGSNYDGISDFAYLLQPRAALMAKLVAPLAMVTNDNYWLTSMYLSSFSFTGFWLFANVIYKITKDKWVAVIPTIFYPSIVFWSSGVLKESLAIGALAGVMAIFISTYTHKKITWPLLLFFFPGLLLLMFLKYYFAAVFFVTVISGYLSRIIVLKRAPWQAEIGSLIAIFLVILGLASLLHINLWPSRFLSVMVNNYHQYVLSSAADNVVEFKNLQPTVLSFLLYSPKALFAGLFFPLWWGTFNMLKLFAVIENWLVLMLFIYAARHFQIPKQREMRILLWLGILFVIITAIFITFSAPNLGTLARYKIGYMFVFVTIILAGIRNRKKAP